MVSITAALDALDAAVEMLGAADIEELPAPPQRFAAVERLERAVRRQRAVSHQQITHLERYAGCPPIPIVLADVLRISRTAAKRRLRDAEQLTPRTTLTGEPLAALLPETGKAWAAGELDGEHVRVIQKKFFRDLPDHVGPVEVDDAERAWRSMPGPCGPINWRRWPIGWPYTSTPTASTPRRTGRASAASNGAGGQRPDGMSVGKLIADPLLRAQLDALFAKTAAPEPDDVRSHAQRQHDALADVVRSRLGDPKLGRHNGLPVTMIVTTTLQELQAGAGGHAVTAGGTLIPHHGPYKSGRAVVQLSGGVRRSHGQVALVGGAQQEVGIGRSANHVVGQISRLYRARLHGQRLQQPGSPCGEGLETRRQDRYRRHDPGM